MNIHIFVFEGFNRVEEISKWMHQFILKKILSDKKKTYVRESFKMYAEFWNVCWYSETGGVNMCWVTAPCKYHILGQSKDRTLETLTITFNPFINVHMMRTDWLNGFYHLPAIQDYVNSSIFLLTPDSRLLDRLGS